MATGMADPTYWNSIAASPSVGAARGLGTPADPYDTQTPRAVANPTSGYPYATGVDPTYDAWLATYGSGTAHANDDATLHRSQADQLQQTNDGTIDTNAVQSRHNLTGGLLSRGVFRSGETGVRQGQLEAGVLTQHQQNAQTHAQTYGQISSDLSTAIASLDQQNLTQVDAAINRQTAKQQAADQKAAQTAADLANGVPATSSVYDAVPAAVDPAAVDAPAPVAAPAPVSPARVKVALKPIAKKKITPAATPAPSYAPPAGSDAQRSNVWKGPS